MEVANDGDVNAALVQAFDDGGDGRGGFLGVYRNANKFRTGLRQSRNLLDGAGNVGCAGVGHRLHDDRDLRAYANLPDFDYACFPALYLSHAYSLPANSLLLAGNMAGCSHGRLRPLPPRQGTFDGDKLHLVTASR
jgi:hypothetical protein